MLLAWTTVANAVDAEKLAADVVSRNLAVCAQVEGPIVSHYRWENKLHRDEEYRLCFKLLPQQASALERHVTASHPYAVPEWVVVNVEHVGEKYLSWAHANSSTPPL